MPKSDSGGPPTADVPPAVNENGVRCPRCGNPRLLRVRRRLLDRLLGWVRPVYRFRCADPGCAWEGTLPQKWFARDWQRRHYRY
jgi:DNA-directed RNA polymerase subunit RPC12/RpoP